VVLMPAAPPVPSPAPDPGVVHRLRAAGCVFAEEEAGLLQAAAAPGPALEALVNRRVGGQPLEHLLGWVAFRGHRYAVAPGVFVPRRRSELLVDLAVRELRRVLDAGPGGRPLLVDLCCGCGAIGASTRRELGPRLIVHASDLQPAAVACARQNLHPLGGQVHEGDLFDALPPGLRGRVQVLVANAPYVPSGEVVNLPAEARLHEPRQALDGGADGLQVFRRLAGGAREWLVRGGVLITETGHAQAAAARRVLAGHGLSAAVHRREDLDATAVLARAAG
jgi:release factor glutamine methyltransferase